jgi:uncharacterized lipoprotein YajG
VRRAVWTRAGVKHLLGFLAALELAAACGRSQQTTFERPPAPVTMATAVARDVPVYIDAVCGNGKRGLERHPRKSLRERL